MNKIDALLNSAHTTLIWGDVCVLILMDVEWRWGVCLKEQRTSINMFATKEEKVSLSFEIWTT